MAFLVEQGTLILALAVWSLMGAVLLRLCVRAVRELSSGGDFSLSYAKAYVVVFGAGLAGLPLRALINALADSNALSPASRARMCLISFFFTAGGLIVAGPTTAWRACCTAALYLAMVLTIGFGFAWIATLLHWLMATA